MDELSGATDTDALLTYYRNRASNLEFEFLQFQLQASKRVEELERRVAELESGDSADD